MLLSLGKAMEAEVETLVKELLQKSSDTNKFIRQEQSPAMFANIYDTFALNWLHVKSRSDANTALDVLAENLSVYKVARQ